MVTMISAPIDRAEDRSHAADQRHQDDFAGGGPMHVGQGGALRDDRLGRAGQSRQRGGQHESHELVTFDA